MADDIWTIGRCLTWTEGFLARKGEERPRLAAEWLLSAATGLSRIELYMNHDRPLSPDELATMRDGVARRAQGEPLQYIAGETSFRMLEVTCAPGVLIPRPETESLVEAVLAFIDQEVVTTPAGAPARERVALPWSAEIERAHTAEAKAAEAADAPAEPLASAAELETHDTPSASAEAEDGASHADEEPRFARVLEVGCGTGCISLSLASERPGRVRCLATDIEPRAVELARRNRERAGLTTETVSFLLGDLVDPVPAGVRGTFDVLVSNPPYVPSSVMETLPREVAVFEPALALDGGPDGLDVFRRLLAAAPSMLRPGGLFACELFEGAVEEAAALCRAAGLVDVRVLHDLTDRPRFVLAYTSQA